MKCPKEMSAKHDFNLEWNKHFHNMILISTTIEIIRIWSYNFYIEWVNQSVVIHFNAECSNFWQNYNITIKRFIVHSR